MNSRGPSSRAFTLLEVVATAVLAATVLTTVVTVQQRSVQRAADLERLDTATALSNELLHHWRLNGGTPPAAAEGVFYAQPGWHWRTVRMPSALLAPGVADEITLTLSHRAGDGVDTDVAVFTWLERTAGEDDG